MIQTKGFVKCSIFVIFVQFDQLIDQPAGHGDQVVHSISEEIEQKANDCIGAVEAVAERLSWQLTRRPSAARHSSMPPIPPPDHPSIYPSRYLSL